MRESDIEQIRKDFYDNDVIPSYRKLRETVSKDIDDDDLRLWYDSQEITQIIGGYRRPKKFYHILAYQPMERVFADTIYIKRYGIALVVFIDLFSKFGYAKLYSDTFRDDGISSLKASKAFEEFLDEIKKYRYKTIGSIQTDEGSEFKSKFKLFCLDKNIDHKIANPKGTKRPMSPVERFNRTLRTYIEKYRNVFNKKLGQKNIDKFIDVYNNTSHSSILDYTPIEALTDREAIDKIHFHNIEKRKQVGEESNIKVGDYVRHYKRKDTDKFNKVGLNWSRGIFVVEEYDKDTNQYKISNDNKYPPDYLKVIDKKAFDKYNYKPDREETIIDEPKPRNVRLTKDIKDVLNTPVIEGKRVRKQRQILDL